MIITDLTRSSPGAPYLETIDPDIGVKKNPICVDLLSGAAPLLEGRVIPLRRTPEYTEGTTYSSPELITFGSKHDHLAEARRALAGISEVPLFFGISHDQIAQILEPETHRAWIKAACSKDPSPHKFKVIQEMVYKDIMRADIPLLDAQKKAFSAFVGKKIIVRSSSLEDTKEKVNAGVNATIAAVEPTLDDLKTALALVVSSYFNNRMIDEKSPSLPICSVLIMEQIISEEGEPPVTSGVMMTSKPNWGGMCHISSTWGFGAGIVSSTTECDEFVFEGDHCYSTIRPKRFRVEPKSDGTNFSVPNAIELQTIPSLTKSQIDRIRDIGQKLESHFEGPLDVEFVLLNNIIYVVQVRPLRALPLLEPTYIDPMAIPELADKIRCRTIVSGQSQALSLSRRQICVARNLEEAEHLFSSSQHKAVLVTTYENSNSHPAVNFDSLRPPIPCLAMPNMHLEKYSDLRFYVCPQSGLVLSTNSNLSIRKGLYLHPYNLPISIDDETHPLQDQSHHPLIKSLRQLLKTTPEEFFTHFDEIQSIFRELFTEIHMRGIKQYEQIRERLKEAIERELSIIRSFSRDSLIPIAFHITLLRQLVAQDFGAIGAHSLSGLESATFMRPQIRAYVESIGDNHLVVNLALLGEHATDDEIISKYLDFLEKIEDPRTLLLRMQSLGSSDLLSIWFSIHFTKTDLPSIDELLTESPEESQYGSFRQNIKRLSEQTEIVSCTEELDAVWKQLNILTDAFFRTCKRPCEKEIFDQLVISDLFNDLVQLWDSSTKRVRNSRLFSRSEEQSTFKRRVDEFEEFTKEASYHSLVSRHISYALSSLKEGSERRDFNVQDWIYPFGSRAAIKTDDQRLSVLHQNLLQFSGQIAIAHLPQKLLAAFDVYNSHVNIVAKRYGSEKQLFFSLTKKQASIKINIPLNIHNAVVTILQNKGSNALEVELCIRHSDNDRSSHLSFFQMLTILYPKIKIQDSSTLASDLKILLSVSDLAQFETLCKSIDYLLLATIYSPDYYDFFSKLLDDGTKTLEQIAHTILTAMWQLYTTTGTGLEDILRSKKLSKLGNNFIKTWARLTGVSVEIDYHIEHPSPADRSNMWHLEPLASPEYLALKAEKEELERQRKLTLQKERLALKAQALARALELRKISPPEPTGNSLGDVAKWVKEDRHCVVLHQSNRNARFYYQGSETSIENIRVIYLDIHADLLNDSEWPWYLKDGGVLEASSSIKAQLSNAKNEPREVFSYKLDTL